ncbi:hypothetical protein KKF32_04930 [Patescibacteria group bacterium]|nr:hypothetical protein [Patescibacteria group bacterium]
MKKLKLWLLYFLFWPGLKKLGNVSKADVIAIQAFGRGAFQDRELAEEVRKLFEELHQKDWATILELRQRGFDPGEPNRQLARICQKLVDKHHLPVITQWEVAVALDYEWYVQYKEKIICLWPPADPEEYFDTWAVKQQTVKIMRQYNWQVAIELAHQRMIVRACLILYKLGVTPVVCNQKVTCFDAKSVQPWTTSWFRWIKREFLTRGHHILYRRVW